MPAPHSCAVGIASKGDPILGVAALPGGRLLWHGRTALRVCDSASGACLATFAAHAGGINGVRVLADGRILTWSDDGALRAWDAATGECVTTFAGHTAGVGRAHQLANGNLLSWAHDGTLRLWSCGTGACIAVLAQGAESFDDVQELADGRFVVVGDGVDLQVRDGRTGQRMAALEGDPGRILGVRVMPNGDLVSWCSGHKIAWWDADHGVCLAERSVSELAPDGVLPLAGGRVAMWTPDCEDAALRVWDPKRGSVNTLKGHTGYVRGGRELDGTRLLTWAADGTMRVWDAERGRCLDAAEETEALRLHPEWWVARGTTPGHGAVAGRFVLAGAGRCVHLVHMDRPAHAASWHADVRVAPRCLLANGIAVVELVPGNFRCIEFCQGNRRITLGKLGARMEGWARR